MICVQYFDCPCRCIFSSCRGASSLAGLVARLASCSGGALRYHDSDSGHAAPATASCSAFLAPSQPISLGPTPSGRLFTTEATTSVRCASSWVDEGTTSDSPLRQPGRRGRKGMHLCCVPHTMTEQFSFPSLLMCVCRILRRVWSGWHAVWAYIAHITSTLHTAHIRRILATGWSRWVHGMLT